MNEKEALSDSINKAKLNTEINIDSSIAINKEKQRIASIFEGLAKTKSVKELEMIVIINLTLRGIKFLLL